MSMRTWGIIAYVALTIMAIIAIGARGEQTRTFVTQIRHSACLEAPQSAECRAAVTSAFIAAPPGAVCAALRAVQLVPVRCRQTIRHGGHGLPQPPPTSAPGGAGAAASSGPPAVPTDSSTGAASTGAPHGSSTGGSPAPPAAPGPQAGPSPPAAPPATTPTPQGASTVTIPPPLGLPVCVRSPLLTVCN